jgi:hypothetical protein
MNVTPEDLQRAEEECERLRTLAHEAPLNPYRLDADGHRWTEQQSTAWRGRSNDWMRACERRDAIRAALRGGN